MLLLWESNALCMVSVKKDTLYTDSDTLYVDSPVTEQNINEMMDLALKYAAQITDTLESIKICYEFLPSVHRDTKVHHVQRINRLMTDLDTLKANKFDRISGAVTKYLDQILNKDHKQISRNTQLKLKSLTSFLEDLTQEYYRGFRIEYLKYRAHLSLLYGYDPKVLGLTDQEVDSDNKKRATVDSVVTSQGPKLVGEISIVLGNYAVVDIIVRSTKFFEGMTLNVYDGQSIVDSEKICEVEVRKVESWKLSVKVKGDAENQLLKVGQLVAVP
jgi:hypothetical protein